MRQRGLQWDSVGDNETTWGDNETTWVTMRQHGWEWDNAGENETMWVTMRQRGWQHWQWDNMGENGTRRVRMRQRGWQWDNLGENETTWVRMRQRGWKWDKAGDSDTKCVQTNDENIFIYICWPTRTIMLCYNWKSIRERRKMWIYPRNRYMLAWLSRGSGALWKYQSFKFFWHCTFYLYILTFLDFPE